MLDLIAAFFEFSWERFTNPWVISGIAVMLVGILLVIFRAKLSYEIAKRLKNPSDEKMERVQLAVMIISLIIVVAGAILAVAFI